VTLLGADSGRTAGRVRVTVPATSANCGPGFDALGIALRLHNEVELREADGVAVEIAGEGADRLPRDGRNIVVQGVRVAYEAVGRPFRGLRVRQQNRIPPSRGLGSSASAWLAGLLGGNALLGHVLSREQVMELAVAREGHPDNLGAALYGGLAVTCWDGEARRVLTLPVPEDLRFAVLVPEREASTAEARAALPSTYSRADAVFNVGRTALLLAALVRERRDCLDAAMRDRLHQPYRAQALFPWLDAVFEAARARGALGAALSGAGPSVLAVVERERVSAVTEAMEEALRRAGEKGVALVLEADPEGARVMEFSD
jgi:homoserine kinase